MGRKTRSLYTQLALVVSLIIAATFLSFGLMTAKQETDTLGEIMQNEADLITRHLAESVASYLVVNDYAGLEEFLVRAAELPDIERIQVSEMSGAALADVIREPGSSAHALIYPERFSPPVPPIADQYFDKGRLVVLRPVSAGSPLGWVRAAFRLDKLAAIQSAVWKNTAALAAVWIAAGFGLLLIVLKRPASEIGRLAKFARGLNDHKGGVIETPSAPIEIEQLGNALNFASRELLASEERLIGERERLAAVLESMGEGLIVIDREYRILLANKAYSMQVGMPLGDIPGKRCYELAHRLNSPCSMVMENHPCAATHTFATGEPCTTMHRHIDLSGGGIFVETRSFPMRDAEGRVTAVIETVVDVTEKRKLEEQLRQAQKMEAVGQLAGGVAHDFNNILTAIVGYGNLLMMQSRENDPGRHFLEQILASSDRATQLTRSLLTFSRKQVMEMRPLDVNETINGVENLLRRLIGEDIELRTVLTDARLPVIGDAGQIEQVLVNLATNARDAMPRGGILSIETGTADMPAAAHDRPSEGPRRAVLIAVTDTGVGMSEDTREKIFEPFFTTKAVGKGTGLGLAIVYGIVKQHGGAISVYSEPDKGTSFKIYLPLVSAQAGDERAEVQAAPRGGSETVLLAEDDAAVRRLVKLIMEGAGYRVIEALDGEEAVQIFARDPDAVHLLLTDVVMPRKNGRDVYEAAAALRPGIKTLFLSGYTADIIQQKGVLSEGVNYLSKPVSPYALLRKVREILDGPPREGPFPAGTTR